MVRWARSAFEISGLPRTLRNRPALARLDRGEIIDGVPRAQAQRDKIRKRRGMRGVRFGDSHVLQIGVVRGNAEALGPLGQEAIEPWRMIEVGLAGNLQAAHASLGDVVRRGDQEAMRVAGRVRVAAGIGSGQDDVVAFDASFASAVRAQERSTSATLQAWATQPRGVYGLSASQISLIEPTHSSPR